MRDTNSCPVKHPLVKLTVLSTMPVSAGMVFSVSSAPMRGHPTSMRNRSSSAPAGTARAGPRRSATSPHSTGSISALTRSLNRLSRAATASP
jgi:hypothetical protein